MTDKSEPQFTIDLTDLFKIRCRGKELILQYTTDKAAWQAYIKQFKKAMNGVREVREVSSDNHNTATQTFNSVSE